jgi:hypothetical protein
MCSGRPLGKIAADLTEQWQGDRFHSGNLRDVHPEQLVNSLRRSNPFSGLPFFFLLLEPLRLRLRSGGKGFSAGSIHGAKAARSFSIS